MDLSIVRLLQNDYEVPLDILAKKLGVPKSTLHYRIKRLEKDGVIDGYYAKVNALKLGYDYAAIVLVKARYGPHYLERVGMKIASIPVCVRTSYSAYEKNRKRLTTPRPTKRRPPPQRVRGRNPPTNPLSHSTLDQTTEAVSFHHRRCGCDFSSKKITPPVGQFTQRKGPYNQSSNKGLRTTPH